MLWKKGYPENVVGALSVNVSSKLTNDRSVVLLFADEKLTPSSGLAALYIWQLI